MLHGDAVLPTDWMPRSLGFAPKDGQSPWFNRAKDVLERLGPIALSLSEVRALVFRATGLDPSATVRSDEWIQAIPETDWAVEAAWRERCNRKGRYRPGGLYAAAQGFRSVDDELSSLRVLEGAGCEVVTQDREPGQPDWMLCRNGIGFHVEVKSKGSREEALELLHEGLVSSELLTPGLRAIQWHIDIGMADLVTPWAHAGALDAVLRDYWALRDDTAEWLQACRTGGREPGAFARERIRIRWWGPELTLELADGRLDSHLSVNAVLEQPAHWVFDPYMSYAAYVPPRVPSDTIEALARAFLGHVQKQAHRFPRPTLYLLHWPAPLEHDDPLAEHPDDLNQILEMLSEGAASAYERVPIALWPRSFARTSRRIFLNGPAQDLLARDCLEDRAPWH